MLFGNQMLCRCREVGTGRHPRPDATVVEGERLHEIKMGAAQCVPAGAAIPV